jgi:hypothetical protein
MLKYWENRTNKIEHSHKQRPRPKLDSIYCSKNRENRIPIVNNLLTTILCVQKDLIFVTEINLFESQNERHV